METRTRSQMWGECPTCMRRVWTRPRPTCLACRAPRLSAPSPCPRRRCSTRMGLQCSQLAVRHSQPSNGTRGCFCAPCLRCACGPVAEIGTPLGDPENPPCARLVLTGSMVNHTSDPDEEKAARAALFGRHPYFSRLCACQSYGSRGGEGRAGGKQGGGEGRDGGMEGGRDSRITERLPLPTAGLPATASSSLS